MNKSQQRYRSRCFQGFRHSGNQQHGSQQQPGPQQHRHLQHDGSRQSHWQQHRRIQQRHSFEHHRRALVPRPPLARTARWLLAGLGILSSRQWESRFEVVSATPSQGAAAPLDVATATPPLRAAAPPTAERAQPAHVSRPMRLKHPVRPMRLERPACTARYTCGALANISPGTHAARAATLVHAAYAVRAPGTCIAGGPSKSQPARRCRRCRRAPVRLQRVHRQGRHLHHGCGLVVFVWRLSWLPAGQRHAIHPTEVKQFAWITGNCIAHRLSL